MIVCHHCDNPPCVNPDHLYLGTHADNARDRKLRNRGVKGTRVNTNKLTERQVQEVRYLKGLESSRDVAFAYEVTQAMVCMIWRAESWTWLPWRPQKPSARIQAQIHEGGLRRRREGRKQGARKKSKASRGTGNPSAKLTEAQVYEIRALFDQRTTSQQKIADAYGISQGVVSAIGRRATWSHLL